MKGQTIKGIAGFIGLSVLAGAASVVGSHLGAVGIDKMHALKRTIKQKKQSKGIKIIKF